MKPVGRVHRTLSPSSSTELFALDLVEEARTFTDQLVTVTTSRGGDGSSTPAPSTMAATVVGELPPAGDESARFRLTDHGATLVADLTGKPADTIRDRWAGRIGAQTVTDKGPAEKYGNRVTTLEAAHWLAQLALIDHLPVFSTTGMTVNRAAGEMLRKASLPLTPYTATGHPTDPDVWDTIAVSSEDLGSSFRDMLGVYTSAAGTHWRTRRAGGIDLRHIAAREAAAKAWKTTVPIPLHRSQCLAPVTWRQPATSPAEVPYSYRDPDGTVRESWFRVYSSTNERPIRSESLDLTKLHNRTGFAQAVALARANELAGVGYRVESVTIDLVMLLASPNLNDRVQAGQLLALEYDDPIVLSHDWPVWVNGCYIAEQITERVSRDAWTITLDLAPVRAVVGGTGPADISGPTWDTRWATSTTWDTVPGTNWEAL